MKSKGSMTCRVVKETPIFDTINATENERRVMAGKVYEILDRLDDWYKIRFGSKFGYIPAANVEILESSPIQKIMVAWDHIGTKEANKEHYKNYINKNCIEQGFDVISPTWFTREGEADKPETIKVVEKCDKEYVRIAHSNGYEVWALIADFNADRNYTVYFNEELVEKEIKSIVDYALEYDLDGINIDFEGFGSRCRDKYNKYVKRLSEELRKHNIIVSIDITKESNSEAWGKCYDRKEISKHVDYVAYMAYDENGRLDVIPGSTGSLPWVEEGIVELLKMGIHKEKILLGVPFYTRDWKVVKVQPEVKSVVVTEWEDIAVYEKADKTSKKYTVSPGEVLSYLGEDKDWYKVMHNSGKRYINKDIATLLRKGEVLYKSINVDPLIMKNINTLCKDAIVDYDDKAQQWKITYKDSEGYLHFVWAEEENSMEKRINLVKKYDLPGAAAWMLTQEKEEIWTVIKGLKQ